jgi:hypothetical protein
MHIIIVGKCAGSAAFAEMQQGMISIPAPKEIQKTREIMVEFLCISNPIPVI